MPTWQLRTNKIRLWRLKSQVFTLGGPGLLCCVWVPKHKRGREQFLCPEPGGTGWHAKLLLEKSCAPVSWHFGLAFIWALWVPGGPYRRSILRSPFPSHALSRDPFSLSCFSQGAFPPMGRGFWMRTFLSLGSAWLEAVPSQV